MKNIPKEDKYIERERYDSRSSDLLHTSAQVEAPNGAQSVDIIYRAPYLLFENHIKNYILSQHRVLEIGSGSGLHTGALLETGAHVTASDIAPSSLALLEKSLSPKFGERLETKVADMESLPFSDATFDIVTCAGSLSYGDPDLVNSEIKRVLKPGGIFICVDSLNHNPIYRLNRYIQYLRGKRTASTLDRMPSFHRIESFREMFDSVEVKFFGSLTWAAPLLKAVIGSKKTARMFDSVDQIINVGQSAFKFVMIGKK
jgi:ubiquinone/menaquinone biosynthesis C-methylase UbiE